MRKLNLALIVLVVLALASSSVLAQEVTDGGESRQLKIAAWMFAAGAASDDASTCWALNRYRDHIWEANPLIKGLDQQPVLLTTVSVAADVAGAWAWTHFVGRKHRRIAIVGFYAMAGVRTWLAIKNTRNIRSAARMPTLPPPGTFVLRVP